MFSWCWCVCNYKILLNNNMLLKNSSYDNVIFMYLINVVEWTKARQRCSVPSAQYKISADDITDYSENTIAWTSSSIYTSYLTDYYGKLYTFIFLIYNICLIDFSTVSSVLQYFFTQESKILIIKTQGLPSILNILNLTVKCG